jgi:hypothetical protein
VQTHSQRTTDLVQNIETPHTTAGNSEFCAVTEYRIFRSPLSLNLGAGDCNKSNSEICVQSDHYHLRGATLLHFEADEKVQLSERLEM